MTMARPAYKISASKPGSDVAGETAAALAAGYLVFKSKGKFTNLGKVYPQPVDGRGIFSGAASLLPIIGLIADVLEKYSWVPRKTPPCILEHVSVFTIFP